MNEQASRLIQLLQLEKKELKSGNAKVISVCSGKGGTGKTFFAANFAFALSNIGKRVLLIDFDLNLSNLNIILNQTSANSISEFFEQRKSLDELIFSYSKNLHLIFGDSGKEYFPRISKEIIDYFFISLNKISVNYDFIIIDSAAGASDITIQQLLNSDYNIIVTSSEPTAVMDAYVLMKLLKAENSSSIKLVVINKASDEEDGRNSFQNIFVACKHFLEEEPIHLGSISFDIAAHKSVVNQQLLLENDETAKSSMEIKFIAKSFVEFVQVANNNQRTFSH
ncbi:MAG: AAA family ATPase [Ignavibacteriales bacterium]|nr:AAA family ATPase [Ignavibacteriales bacterium]